MQNLPPRGVLGPPQNQSRQSLSTSTLFEAEQTFVDKVGVVEVLSVIVVIVVVDLVCGVGGVGLDLFYIAIA